ncbi:hypothetical protein KGS77_17545 [Streptomyces sp. MST-110588]|nr:hypothetical protein KGS77_17545 [Streptomyces sp. MST-110588]
MNMQHAAEYADAVISGTLAAVQPPVQWTHGESTHGPCTDFRNRSLGTGTVTRRAVVTTVISDERRGSFLGVVERYWKSKGYKITTVRQHKKNPAMFAFTPENFQLALEVGYKGQVFIDVVTPCATESKVASPKTKTNGPDYSGQDIPTPNVRSDFWSKGAPVS